MSNPVIIIEAREKKDDFVLRAGHTEKQDKIAVVKKEGWAKCIAKRVNMHDRMLHFIESQSCVCEMLNHSVCSRCRIIQESRRK